MKTSLVAVKVRNGDLAHALKIFKKKVSASGHIDELRRRQEYIKPSLLKRVQKQKAIRNRERNLRLERE